ncbi:MAG TPA: 2-amino-4-hydroxy-6-hydroxymethyldihydropteridine diphosphokinase [Polyangia bacterium]|jgi:2-amino-4-hydroxy-6-hydroxymethyldihydropteridine diphosphokinase
MHTAYVGLGANLGDRLATLREAVRRLGQDAAVAVRRCSPVYETAPWGPIQAQPAFLNAVCEVATTLDPRGLLDRLLAIEAALGRVRDVPQGPRVVDLDLLLYDAAVVEEPGLTVPHPRLSERAFVLVPLADLAPALVPPGGAEPIAARLARLGGAGVTRVTGARLD